MASRLVSFTFDARHFRRPETHQALGNREAALAEARHTRHSRYQGASYPSLVENLNRFPLFQSTIKNRRVTMDLLEGDAVHGN
jgi:hypothetical protein